MFSESTTCSQWPNWQKMKINELKNLLFRNISKENMTSHLLPNLPPIAPLTLCLVKWKEVFKRGKETSAWTLESPPKQKPSYKGYMFQRAKQDEGESSTAYPT